MMVANKAANATDVKERAVYLSPALSALIAGLHRGEGRVFLNTRGEPRKPHAVGAAVLVLRIKLDLPKGTVPYGFRHKFASRAINDADVNPALVARRLGHSDLGMLLKHYFRESPEAMLRAVEKMTK
jgi:integrase